MPANTRSAELQIRAATVADAEAICAIYNGYVRDSVATFEIRPVPGTAMIARIEAVQEHRLPWLIGEIAGEVIAYAYACPWKERAAYSRTVESTIYLSPRSLGQGHGRRLYAALLDHIQALPIHAVLAGIALPNPASISLHQGLGFTKVAHLRQVGWKLDRWIDVSYWQRLL